jgi:hypothetical protein
MITRITQRTVTFRGPFMLSGLDAAQPAGSYTIETHEQQLDTISVSAYRRMSTTIELHPRADRAPLIETVSIDPEELEAALVRDAGI